MSANKKLVFVSKLIDPRELILNELDRLKPDYDVKLGKQPFDEQIAINELKDAAGCLIGLEFPVTRKVIESAPNLKVISKYGAGFENIDVEAATEHGIIVAYSPLNSVAVAEGTIFLMLGCLRKINLTMKYIHTGGWKTSSVPGELAGQELGGKTVGIVGLGRIGSLVARILKGFDVRILGFDPYVSAEKAASIGVKLVTLETLLRESDIVTLHFLITPETRHLIGEKELGLMKPTAYLINAARGAAVDEKPLIAALEGGRIAGAGLDVIEKEPPDPNHPLLKLSNVFVTPHSAAATVEARMKTIVQASRSLVDVLQGRLPPRELIVNLKVLETRK